MESKIEAQTTPEVESQCRKTTPEVESPCRTLNESFAKLFDEGISTDVVFLIGEDRTEVKGHKLVLSARSQVFNVMFNGKFQDKGEIEIQDAKAEEFECFMRFLYSDEIDLSQDNIIEILHLADKYNVPLLIKKCVQYLTENLSIDNACTVFAAAKKYNSEVLIDAALNYICLHAKDCLRTEAFLELSADDVEDISGHESLSCKEESLFESLDMWAGEKCKERELDVTDENKRTVLGKLVFTVRFSLMEYEYLVNKVSIRQMCSESEVIQILQSHLAKRENRPLMIEDEHTPKFKNYARKPLTYDSVVLVEQGLHTLELTGISDQLRNTNFEIDTDTWFYGIMIYGPENALRFCVELIVVDVCDKTELTRESMFVQTSGNSYTCNVALDGPVYLKAKRRYRCSFTVFTPKSSQFYQWQSRQTGIPSGFSLGYAQPPNFPTGSTSYAQPPKFPTATTKVVVHHYDSFVAEKVVSEPTIQGYTIKKTLRQKTIKVANKNAMLAGFLLF